MGPGVEDGAAMIKDGSWSLLLAVAVFTYCAWVIRDGRDEVEAEGVSDIEEVLVVACPRCGAQAGEACVRRHRGSGTMHAARIVQWRKTTAVREELAARARTLARLEGGVI